VRHIIAVVAIALLAAGCDDQQQARSGKSFQQHQEEQLRRDLAKVQKEVNRNVQKSIETGQNAIKAARPRSSR